MHHVALGVVHAQVRQRGQNLRRLRLLGHYLQSEMARYVCGRADQGLLDGVVQHAAE